jgi:hypothetical protein
MLSFADIRFFYRYPQRQAIKSKGRATRFVAD